MQALASRKHKLLRHLHNSLLPLPVHHKPVRHRSGFPRSVPTRLHNTPLSSTNLELRMAFSLGFQQNKYSKKQAFPMKCLEESGDFQIAMVEALST
jgi:hypothetical protein